jgi:hypothetical protein
MLVRKKHSSLLDPFVSYKKLSSVNSRPGACIIKLITAVIYGLRNKPECLSLASLSSLVECLGTSTLA